MTDVCGGERDVESGVVQGVCIVYHIKEGTEGGWYALGEYDTARCGCIVDPHSAAE